MNILLTIRNLAFTCQLTSQVTHFTWFLENRERDAASSRRYVNAFSVTGVWSMNEKLTMHLTLTGGSLWHKQMRDCGNKKGTCGTRHPLFCLQETFFSEEWVRWNSFKVCRSVSVLSDTKWHIRTMHYVFGRRARTLCSRGNVVRSLCAFLFEKSSALVCPFSRENWGNHLPPASRVRPLLRQWGDWYRADCRWSLLTSLREELMAVSLICVLQQSCTLVFSL